MYVRLQVFGTTEVAFELRGIELRAGSNFNIVWTYIEEDMRRLTREQFSSKGGYRGQQPWPELAPSTIKEKAKHPEWDQRIMRRTNALYKSLTYKSDANAIRVRSGTDFAFGTKLEYAKYHHSTRPRRGNLPRRPLINVNQSDVRRYSKAIQRHIRYGRL